MHNQSKEEREQLKDALTKSMADVFKPTLAIGLYQKPWIEKLLAANFRATVQTLKIIILTNKTFLKQTPYG